MAISLPESSTTSVPIATYACNIWYKNVNTCGEDSQDVTPLSLKSEQLTIRWGKNIANFQSQHGTNQHSGWPSICTMAWVQQIQSEG